jgi:hypothetical protein
MEVTSLPTPSSDYTGGEQRQPLMNASFVFHDDVEFGVSYSVYGPVQNVLLATKQAKEGSLPAFGDYSTMRVTRSNSGNAAHDTCLTSSNAGELEVLDAVRVPPGEASYHSGIVIGKHVYDFSVHSCPTSTTLSDTDSYGSQATLAEMQTKWTTSNSPNFECPKTSPGVDQDPTGSSQYRWFYGEFLYDLGMKHQAVVYKVDHTTGVEVGRKFLYDMCWDFIDAHQTDAERDLELLAHCTQSRGPIVSLEVDGEELLAMAISGNTAAGVVIFTLDLEVKSVILMNQYDWRLNLNEDVLPDDAPDRGDEVLNTFLVNAKVAWWLGTFDPREMLVDEFTVDELQAAGVTSLSPAFTSNIVDSYSVTDETPVDVADFADANGHVNFVYLSGSAGQPYLVFDNLNLMLHMGAFVVSSGDFSSNWYNTCGYMMRFVVHPTTKQLIRLKEEVSNCAKTLVAGDTLGSESLLKVYPHTASTWESSPNAQTLEDIEGEKMPVTLYPKLYSGMDLTGSEYGPQFARSGEFAQHAGQQFLYVSVALPPATILGLNWRGEQTMVRNPQRGPVGSQATYFMDTAGTLYEIQSDGYLHGVNWQAENEKYGIQNALDQPTPFIDVSLDSQITVDDDVFYNGQGKITSWTYKGVNYTADSSLEDAELTDGEKRVVELMFSEKMTMAMRHQFTTVDAFSVNGKYPGSYAFLPFDLQSTSSFDPSLTYTSAPFLVDTCPELKTEFMDDHAIECNCAESGHITCDVPGTILQYQPLLLEIPEASLSTYVLDANEATAANFHGVGHYGSVTALTCDDGKKVHVTGGANGNTAPPSDQFGPAVMCARAIIAGEADSLMATLGMPTSENLQQCYGNVYHSFATAVCDANNTIILDCTIKGLRVWAKSIDPFDDEYYTKTELFMWAVAERQAYRSERGARFANGQILSYDPMTMDLTGLYAGVFDDESNREHDFVDSVNAYLKDDGWNRDQHGATVTDNYVFATTKRTGTFVSKADVCSSSVVGTSGDDANGLVTRTTADVYEFLTSTAGAFIFDGAHAWIEGDSVLITTSGGEDFGQRVTHKLGDDDVSGMAIMRMEIDPESFSAKWSELDSQIEWVVSGMDNRQGSVVINDLAVKGSLYTLHVINTNNGETVKDLSFQADNQVGVSGGLVPLGGCRLWLKPGMDAHKNAYGAKRLGGEFAYILGVPSAIDNTIAAQFQGRLFSFSFKHDTVTGFQEFKFGSQPELTFHDAGHTANHVVSWRTTVATAMTLADTIFSTSTRYGWELAVPAWGIIGAIDPEDVIYADASITGDGEEHGTTTSTCPQGFNTAGTEYELSTALQSCGLPSFSASDTSSDKTVVLTMIACEPHVFKNHIGVYATVM